MCCFESFNRLSARRSESVRRSRSNSTAAATSGPASDSERQGAVEHSARTFAREVGRYLDQARNEHRYDQLVLVAPPKFLGALRKELHKEVEKLVVDELPKDLAWFNARQIEEYFATGSGRAP